MYRRKYLLNSVFCIIFRLFSCSIYSAITTSQTFLFTFLPPRTLRTTQLHESLIPTPSTAIALSKAAPHAAELSLNRAHLRAKPRANGHTPAPLVVLVIPAATPLPAQVESKHSESTFLSPHRYHVRRAQSRPRCCVSRCLVAHDSPKTLNLQHSDDSTPTISASNAELW